MRDIATNETSLIPSVPDIIDLTVMKQRYENSKDEMQYSDWLSKVINMAKKYRDIEIYCDGSARFITDRCISASCGLFIIPNTKCISLTSASKLDAAYGLSLSNAAGITGTPFDAELEAGVAACSVANAITKV